MISKFLEIFSRSLEHFFLTVGQNNFGNKIPFTDVVNWFLQLKNVIWISKLGPNLQNLQKFAFTLKVSRFLNILSNIDLFGEWISALNINFAEFLNIFWYRVESKFKKFIFWKWINIALPLDRWADRWRLSINQSFFNFYYSLSTNHRTVLPWFLDFS